MLNIIKASDPMTVEQIIVCIYGAPGVGKTTAAFSAASPLLLDFDKGAYRAANRKDAVVINSWSEVEGLSANDFKGYDTVVIDTAGRALDCLALDICERNIKHGKDGSLTLKGYGELKSRFSKWLKTLTSFGKDVILIAHMDEQKNGDDIIERIDAQGSSKNEIYKSADAMGRLSIVQRDHILDFNPTSASLGKNPTQLEPLKVPNITTNPNFMADVIARIKGKLNEQTETQRQLQAQIAEWQQNVKALKTAADFNEAVAQVKGAPKAVKAVISKAADEAGMVFDVKTKKFIDATQPDAVPEENAA